MGKPDHRRCGTGISKSKEKSWYQNNTKISAEEMEEKPYKLPGTSGSEGGSEHISIACVLVLLGSINFCRFTCYASLSETDSHSFLLMVLFISGTTSLQGIKLLFTGPISYSAALLKLDNFFVDLAISD